MRRKERGQAGWSRGKDWDGQESLNGGKRKVPKSCESAKISRQTLRSSGEGTGEKQTRSECAARRARTTKGEEEITEGEQQRDRVGN